MEPRLPALPDKDFFNMGEACRITQVPAHTLRYWEALRLLRPTRLSSGHRRYTREELETIMKVRDMIQRRKMTVAGAKKALLADRRPQAPAEGGEAAAPASLMKVLREVRHELQALARELESD